MVRLGLGLGLGHWLTRGMGAPPPLKPTPMGYGGAWVGGMSFGLAIESLPCHLTSPTSPPHARLHTYANGATPQTHAQTQAPGVMPWAFYPNPRPNPRLIPHGLNYIVQLFMHLTSKGSTS
ncbi:hypothetical protein Hanom_Chr11g00992861 [Helianthus anomalus]